MNKLLPIAGLGVVCWLGWHLGGVLSSDALGMALGVLFGVMAGIPAALIAMSADRIVRHEHVHRLEASQTPQARTERISVPPATNATQLSQNVGNKQLSVVVEGRKRLGVGR